MEIGGAGEWVSFEAFSFPFVVGLWTIRIGGRTVAMVPLVYAAADLLTNAGPCNDLSILMVEESEVGTSRTVIKVALELVLKFVPPSDWLICMAGF